MVDVRIIRSFEGPRNRRLLRIWEAIAEFSAPKVRVQFYNNRHARLHHGPAFNLLYDRARRDNVETLLLTESDFLPDLSMGPAAWTGATRLRRHRDAVAIAPVYATRDPQTRKLTEYPDLAAGWFVCLDLRVAPASLNFIGDPDPANQLPLQASVHLMGIVDAWPHHYGVACACGEHLYGSRYIDDPPDRVFAGFPVGDLQAAHDRAVEAWLGRQPRAFRRLLKEKYSDVCTPR